MSFDNDFDIEDDIYANVCCDICGNTRALCLYDIEDFYIYADSFLDERYFDYTKLNNTKL